MPHIIVTARGESDRGEAAVMLRERVTPADLESGHFASQLVERIGWAVSDADEVEHQAPTRPEHHEYHEDHPAASHEEDEPQPVWAATAALPA